MFRFSKKGDVKPGVIPADICFTVKQKPHNVFTRDGDDLHMKMNITLAQALCGFEMKIPYLDGTMIINE